MCRGHDCGCVVVPLLPTTPHTPLTHPNPPQPPQNLLACCDICKLGRLQGIPQKRLPLSWLVNGQQTHGCNKQPRGSQPLQPMSPPFIGCCFCYKLVVEVDAVVVDGGDGGHVTLCVEDGDMGEVELVQGDLGGGKRGGVGCAAL